MIVTAIFLMGMGTCVLAQNNCPTGYKEIPGTNNSHTGKVVTKSNCTTTTTTENSSQNNVNVSGKGGVKIVGGNADYNRAGATTSTTKQTQQCTQEKTYYFNCESDKKDKDKKNNHRI